MNRKPRRQKKAIDLSRAGPSWAGWHLAPWGRSGELWLIAPDGSKFCAAELLELRELQRAVDFWQVRSRELERLTAPGAVQFSANDAATLRAAASIIARAMPREVARRTGNVLEIVKVGKK